MLHVYLDVHPTTARNWLFSIVTGVKLDLNRPYKATYHRYIRRKLTPAVHIQPYRLADTLSCGNASRCAGGNAQVYSDLPEGVPRALELIVGVLVPSG